MEGTRAVGVAFRRGSGARGARLRGRGRALRRAPWAPRTCCSCRASARRPCWSGWACRWSPTCPPSGRTCRTTSRSTCSTGARSRCRCWRCARSTAGPWIAAQWLLTGTGPGASNHLEATGFFRSDETQDRPDIMMSFAALAMRSEEGAQVDGHGYQLHVGVMRSEARGSVHIRSANPAVHPAIRGQLPVRRERPRPLGPRRGDRRASCSPSPPSPSSTAARCCPAPTSSSPTR